MDSIPVDKTERVRLFFADGKGSLHLDQAVANKWRRRDRLHRRLSVPDPEERTTNLPNEAAASRISEVEMENVQRYLLAQRDLERRTPGRPWMPRDGRWFGVKTGTYLGVFGGFIVSLMACFGCRVLVNSLDESATADILDNGFKVAFPIVVLNGIKEPEFRNICWGAVLGYGVYIWVLVSG